jgi:TIR domain
VRLARPEKKRPDLHFPWEASNELEAQANRIRDRLEDLAESLARNDSGRPDDLRDVVERKHVLLAAKRLFSSDPTEPVLLHAGDGIFLSYSTKDEDFARELDADLRAEGLKSFLAPLSIKPAASWPDEIWQAIGSCRAFVLVVTAEAIKSRWCLLEIGAALGLKKPIVAVLRHSAKLPDVLKTVQAVKVQTKKQQADLVQQLKKMCCP